MWEDFEVIDFALFIQIVRLPHFPAFAQRQYPMKHLFGNHNYLTIYPIYPSLSTRNVE